jgi:hypothetical protein
MKLAEKEKMGSKPGPGRTVIQFRSPHVSGIQVCNSLWEVVVVIAKMRLNGHRDGSVSKTCPFFESHLAVLLLPRVQPLKIQMNSYYIYLEVK